MLRTKSPEGDKVQVRRRQHHLDPDENENGMTATERGKKADGKQCPGYDEEDLKRGRHRGANWIGERTRPARWFRRRAETISSLNFASAGHGESIRKVRDREDARATQAGAPRVIVSPP